MIFEEWNKRRWRTRESRGEMSERETRKGWRNWDELWMNLEGRNEKVETLIMVLEEENDDR